MLKKSKEKRFAPWAPDLCDTLSDNSLNLSGKNKYTSPAHNEDLQDDIEDETQETEKNKREMLAEAKKFRKRKAETIRKNKETDNETALDEYLQNLNDSNEIPDVLDFDETSTPLRNRKNKTSKNNVSANN